MFKNLFEVFLNVKQTVSRVFFAVLGLFCLCEKSHQEKSIARHWPSFSRGEPGEMGQKNLLACCALNFPQKPYKLV